MKMDTVMIQADPIAVHQSEFRRGWRVLVVALIGIITSAGVMPLYTFAAMVKPLALGFHWSRGQLQFTITFFFVGMVISSQLAGVLLKRYGIRRVALRSLIAYAFCYALMSQLTHSIWSLYLGYVLLALCGVGCLQITWTHIVNLWFDKHRGLALAIILSGTGLCSLLVLPPLARVVAAHGWQAGFLALALVPSFIAFPVAYFWLPDGAPKASTLASNAPALTGIPFAAAVRSYRFWVMVVGFTMVVTGILGMLTNSVAMMQDHGIPATTAASVAAASGAALIIGRLATGYLVDRLWAPGVAFVLLSLPAVGCLLFGTVPTDVPLMYLAAALVGLGAGAEYDIASFLVARYFGMLDYSKIFGTQFALTAAGSCIAPLVFGHLIDATGSYSIIVWVCGLSFLIGAALLLSLGAYPRLTSSVLA